MAEGKNAPKKRKHTFWKVLLVLLEFPAIAVLVLFLVSSLSPSVRVIPGRAWRPEAKSRRNAWN